VSFDGAPHGGIRHLVVVEYVSYLWLTNCLVLRSRVRWGRPLAYIGHWLVDYVIGHLNKSKGRIISIFQYS
jgi:hypothetical protein